MQKALVTILFLAYALSAQATDECSQTQSHADQRQCLQSLASSTAAEVTESQSMVRARIQNWDAEVNSRMQALKLLQESNTAFSKFKAKQCNLEAIGAAGGNGAGDLRLDCEIRLNRSYIDELKRRWGLL